MVQAHLQEAHPVKRSLRVLAQSRHELCFLHGEFPDWATRLIAKW